MAQVWKVLLIIFVVRCVLLTTKSDDQTLWRPWSRRGLSPQGITELSLPLVLSEVSTLWLTDPAQLLSSSADQLLLVRCFAVGGAARV